MRIVKTAEERKNEILDVAEELFAEKGKAFIYNIEKMLGAKSGSLERALIQFF